MDPIAVNVIRGNLVESTHRASVAVMDPHGRLIASFGRPGLVSFMRSAAKPMQAIPLIESGAADRFGFGDKELAIAAGSHSGEPRHTQLVEDMLRRVGLSVADLRCGRHAPYGKQAAVAVGENFSSLHHNCSGKHAGMLAVCVHKGWDVASYQSFDHPLQVEIRRIIASETGLAASRLKSAIDGCGVPTFAVPTRSAARAFARLADPSNVDGERRASLERISAAMRAHPALVAGNERLDTDLMTAAQGNLIVKGGAEAFYGAALVRQRLGIAIKIEDGSSRAMPSLLVATLRGLKAAKADFLAATRNHWDEPIRNVAGRNVGRFESVIRLKRHPVRHLRR